MYIYTYFSYHIKDVDFYGYTIPEGTTVMANLYAVHRDENTWENPDEFNPSRFIDREGKVHKREQLISFGLGGYNSIQRGRCTRGNS